MNNMYRYVQLAVSSSNLLGSSCGKSPLTIRALTFCGCVIFVPARLWVDSTGAV